MRKLVASVLIVALCQTQVFATAVVPADPPPQVPDANGRVSEDAFKALSLPQQIAYISARQNVLFAHDTRIDVLNGNNFENHANAVDSYRLWAKLFRVAGFVCLFLAVLGNTVTPTLNLLNVGGSSGGSSSGTTYAPYVQYGLAVVTLLAGFLLGYANTFTTQANNALAAAVADNNEDAQNLLALEAILAAEQRALTVMDNIHADIRVTGPLDRNEALHEFGYRVRQVLEVANLPATGLDRAVQFARMQNTGTRDQALAYLHLLLREGLFHPERMARIVVPHEGMVPVEEAVPAPRNANLVALATVHDHVEPAQPAAAPPPREPKKNRKGQVKVYYTWATPAVQPAQHPQPPAKDEDKEKQEDVPLRPAGNQTEGANLPPANDNAGLARFGAAGTSEL